MLFELFFSHLFFLLSVGGSQGCALPCNNIINISFPRVGIESETCRIYNCNFVPSAPRLAGWSNRNCTKIKIQLKYNRRLVHFKYKKSKKIRFFFSFYPPRYQLMTYTMFQNQSLVMFCTVYCT